MHPAQILAVKQEILRRTPKTNALGRAGLADENPAARILQPDA
jgi:hypothetical protein